MRINFSLYSCLYLLIFLSLFYSITFSQEIIFCKGVTEYCEPIDIIANRKVELTNKVYILLKNKSNLNETAYYFKYRLT